LKLSQIYSIAV